MRHSWIIRETLVRYSWDIRESFVRHSWDTRETFVNHSWDTREHSWIIRETLVNHSWIIREILVRHSWIIRESFVRHSWIIRETLVKHSWERMTTKRRVYILLISGWNKPAFQQETTHFFPHTNILKSLFEGSAIRSQSLLCMRRNSFDTKVVTCLGITFFIPFSHAVPSTTNLNFHAPRGRL